MSASLTAVLYLLYSGKPLITNRILQLPGGSNLNALCYGGQCPKARRGKFFCLGKAFNTLGPVLRKMVKFNPGLSQISSTVFSPMNTDATQNYKILLSLYYEKTQNFTLSSG